MEEILPTLIVVVLAIVVVSTRPNKLTGPEERFLAFALAIHLASSIALPWFSENYLGGGDQLGYLGRGRDLAEAMRRDFVEYAPEVLNIFFQRENALAIYDGVGGSTGSMAAVTAFWMLPLNNSFYATGMVFTLGALSGKWFLYRVYRDAFPEEYRPRLLWATLLVPSVVCWSSGLIKEGLILGPLGWSVYAIHSFNQGKRRTPFAVAAFSIVIIAFIKPYVLLPLTAGGIVWVYWQRAAGGAGRLPVARPLYLFAGVLLAAGAVAGFGKIFPDYSIETFGEHSARAQDLGEQAGGGSLIELGDATERSLLGQLSFAPMALISSLFRPFLFEVKNVLMGIAAIETTVLFFIVARTVWQQSWRKTSMTVWASPILMFSLVFTLLFGVAVGLTTLNLGTLSRYRAPLMPFYVALVLIVSKRRETSAELETSDAEDDDDSQEVVRSSARGS